MLWTVLKPISGSSSPKAMSAVIAVWRSARARSTREAGGDASISHLLHIRSPEDPLRQEDHGYGENGEGSDVLVVDREIRRPHRLDQPDQKAADDGAWERSDASQHRRREGFHPRHEALGEAHDPVIHEIPASRDPRHPRRHHQA